MPDVAFQFANANDVVTSLLKQSASNLEELLDGDVLFYKGLLFPPADRMVRDALELREGKRPKLVFFLETEGGSLEVVVRIVETVRHHYASCVEFVVPNYAFSAGTVLVLSGDEIWMDYFSVLGPIDPQDELPDGRLVPALGYVERYNELIEKSRTPEGLTTAEMTILVSAFDQGRLQMFEHYKEMAIAYTPAIS
jgi:membrane-bound ClpP family serine protease